MEDAPANSREMLCISVSPLSINVGLQCENVIEYAMEDPTATTDLVIFYNYRFLDCLMIHQSLSIH